MLFSDLRFTFLLEFHPILSPIFRRVQIKTTDVTVRRKLSEPRRKPTGV
jgi:hypothetical protein